MGDSRAAGSVARPERLAGMQPRPPLAHVRCALPTPTLAGARTIQRRGLPKRSISMATGGMLRVLRIAAAVIVAGPWPPTGCGEVRPAVPRGVQVVVIPDKDDARLCYYPARPGPCH